MYKQGNQIVLKFLNNKQLSRRVISTISDIEAIEEELDDLGYYKNSGKQLAIDILFSSDSKGAHEQQFNNELFNQLISEVLNVIPYRYLRVKMFCRDNSISVASAILYGITNKMESEFAENPIDIDVDIVIKSDDWTKSSGDHTEHAKFITSKAQEEAQYSYENSAIKFQAYTNMNVDSSISDIVVNKTKDEKHMSSIVRFVSRFFYKI